MLTCRNNREGLRMEADLLWIEVPFLLTVASRAEPLWRVGLPRDMSCFRGILCGSCDAVMEFKR